MILASGCGKKIEAGSPEELLSRVKEKWGTTEVMQLYTDDTVDYLKKYMKLTGMSGESAADVLSFISPYSEYEVSGRSISGDTCTLKLRFTKQSVENLNGLVLDVKMLKENGGWRIDRSDDFKKLVESFKSGGAENYLKSIR